MIKQCSSFVLWLCLIVTVLQAHAAPTIMSSQDVLSTPGTLLHVSKPEFQPVRGKSFNIPFQLNESAQVQIQLYTADGDLLHELKSNESLQPGKHYLTWDGNDAKGLVVPDEAYIPVLNIELTSGEKFIQDPRTYSGGEILEDLRWRLRKKTEIAYELPAPARVLIRAGIKEGPMMRAFTHWEPRISGKIVQRWDGYDVDKVDYFAQHKKAWVLVMAYQLPEFAIITTGNKELSYRDYRKLRQWKRATADFTKVKLHRNGVRLEREYFLPRGFIPQVELSIKDKLPRSKKQLPIAKGKLNFEINIPKEDRWVLESDMYEIGFFVDYEFMGEEEQGFVPMIWSIDTKDLKPGRHIATVQITGFGGYVVSRTMAFETQ